MNTISAQELKNAFILGAARLEENKDIINELNVFPVPDGDTGTNMSMTVVAAVNEISSLDSPEHRVICKAISQGSLRGARGNSGVILSQLFRGFYKAVKTEEEITPEVFAKALEKATETAYRAVMKPKEGTILTIAKAVSEKALELCENNEVEFGALYDALVEHAREVLEKTPDMLPALKQAGVVDSGGRGLLEILTGAADSINGRRTVQSISDRILKEETTVEYGYTLSLAFSSETLSDRQSVADLKVYLESIGKINDFDIAEGALNLKIDSNEPGRAITKLLKSGSIDKVTLTNNNPILHKQTASNDIHVEKSMEKKDVGFVAVSVGAGIDEIFQGLGADYIIKGGQTMNPCTEDILKAIEAVNADTIFILPNNKNIFLSATQAADVTEDKTVLVVPTKTLPQGITALINYQPEKTPEENLHTMTEEIGYVKSGEITYAVRDTIVDDKEIHQGDFMGICDKGIRAVEKDIDSCMLSLVAELVDEESSLLSLYWGEDVTSEAADSLAVKIAEAFPALEVEVQYGGQPVYYYVLSVE